VTTPHGTDAERRDWLSFDHAGDTYLFDLTFLTSSYRCIFGEGCKGVLSEDATELSQGCCSHGAHFADAADRHRVKRMARKLTDDQWQLREVAAELGGPVAKNSDGEWTTRVHDGACVFHNRNDFHRGPGCALHVAALDAGENFLDWKPEVCWQVPLRLTHHTDEVGHTTWTLRDWKRRDWGEGGQEFHWWCTETADAYRSERTVLATMRDEIVALVGEPVYDRLVELVPDATPTTWVPAPRSSSASLP
jgi:hypothetical protein